MSDCKVNIEKTAEGYAILELCDERRHNELSTAMVYEFLAALDEVRDDSSINAVVIAGSPAYFSTGASFELLMDLVDRRIAPEELILPRRILEIPVPTIAALEGHALSGGFALGMCADLVVMAEESRYGCTFMNMGFTPGMGTTRLLEHVLPPAIAHEMLFTGRTFRGSELAGRCGVNYILPKSLVMPKALALAAEIAAKPRQSLMLLKDSLVRSRRRIYEAALEEESRMHRESFAQPGIRDYILEEFGAVSPSVAGR